MIEWRKNGEGVLENTLRILRGWVNTPGGIDPTSKDEEGISNTPEPFLRHSHCNNEKNKTSILLLNTHPSSGWGRFITQKVNALLQN